MIKRWQLPASKCQRVTKFTLLEDFGRTYISQNFDLDLLPVRWIWPSLQRRSTTSLTSSTRHILPNRVIGAEKSSLGMFRHAGWYAGDGVQPHRDVGE